MIRKLLKSILPRSVIYSLQKTVWKGVRVSLEAAGYTVSRKKDYYSPLPAVSNLKAKSKRWNRPSAQKGIEYDIEKMKHRLTHLLSMHLDGFSALPPFKKLTKDGYGPGFTQLDALTLYMMIRQNKPRRYIEVGSGLSTYYCSLAAAQNAAEGYPLQITCIEPYPYEKLSSIPGIQIIVKEVQDVDLSVFQQLEENDILFIDSSHIVKVDSDVPFLFLEVLPILNVGVGVHVHDVPFPYNIPYPPEHWIYNQVWPKFWNEAMFLQAFLCFNTKFSIEMSTPLIRYFDEPFLKKNIPLYESVEQNPMTFSSMWLRRTS